jgi:hypothetical protein
MRAVAEARMRAMVRCVAMMTGVALAAAFAPQARAGGDDYDAMNDTEGLGPAYFGFVRDQRGVPVSDAQVILSPRAGDPVTIKTNVLGLYRSHVRKEVKPDDVAVSCVKAGFKQQNVYRRTPPGAKDMFIETDCTLQKL